jgi:hypothetical protein
MAHGQRQNHQEQNGDNDLAHGDVSSSEKVRKRYIFETGASTPEKKAQSVPPTQETRRKRAALIHGWCSLREKASRFCQDLP